MRFMQFYAGMRMSEVKNYTAAALNVRGLRTQFMQVLIFLCGLCNFMQDLCNYANYASP